jgi:hypothetical protein
MNPFNKNLVERFVGKQFRTITEVLNSVGTPCETCDVTQEDINDLHEFVEYMDFLTEQTISLPQVSAEKPGSVSWGTVKAGLDKVKGGAWKAPGAEKTAREITGLKKRDLFGTEGSNPKLAKEGEAVPEYKTIGLSLSPSTESGRTNTCACATEECRAACLNKSGRGAQKGVQKARLERTNMLLDNPEHFMTVVHHEIDKHERSATKQGKKAAVRLNVVSDIPHEKLHPEVFSDHPNVQFYDYTKIAGRVLTPEGTKRQLPPNYHLTLSSTGIEGAESNWHHARQHLNNGGTVAMVFAARSGRKGKKRTIPGDTLPSHVTDEATGKKYRVIDADTHDHRHLDKKYHGIPEEEGIIAGLRIKGGMPMLKKAGNFAVKMPDFNGSPVVVPASHPANQQK